MLTANQTIQGWHPVTFPGRVDAFNFEEFKQNLSLLCEPEIRLALDLRGVDFVNYEAIRHIHQVAIELESLDGELALIGPTEKLKRQVSLFASLDPIRIFSKREWDALALAGGDIQA